MSYTPSGVAHWGVARVKPSLTPWASAHQRVAISWLGAPTASTRPISTSLLEDGASQRRPTLAKLRRAYCERPRCHQQCDGRTGFQGGGLAKLVTEVRESRDPVQGDQVIHNEHIRLSPASRVAWMESLAHIDLFVDGVHFEVPLPMRSTG